MGMKEELEATRAGKLHAILLRARQNTGAQTVIDGWAKIFEVPPQEPNQVMEKLNCLMELVENVSNDLTKTSITKDYYYDTLASTMRLIHEGALALNSQWPIVINKITPELLSSLKFCSHICFKDIAEKTIPDSEVSKLVEDTKALIAEVRDSKINPELKSAILGWLNKMLDSLINYRLFGNSEVSESFSQTVGGLSIHQKLIIDEPEKDTLKKFWDYMKNINTLISLGMNGKKLLDLGVNVLQITSGT
jgi:hypothetical protein